MKVIANRNNGYPRLTEGKEYEVICMYGRNGVADCWEKCEMVKIIDDNGEKLNAYITYMEDTPVYDKIEKGNEILNVLTGEVRYALRYCGEYIIVKDGQETKGWHLSDIKNLSKQTEVSTTPNLPDMKTTKLSALLANEYLTPEKQKQIAEVSKIIRKKIEDTKALRDEYNQQYNLLVQQYEQLEVAYEDNDNEAIEEALKVITQ